MALYDYTCKDCNSSVTISRGISEKEDIPFCSACNKPFSRVYSSIAVAFNGSGFYSTDK